MTRRCACCRLPAPLAHIHHGHINALPVVFGLCPRCSQANAKLPPGTRQKRLNACARLAATDQTEQFYILRLPDAGAAQLAVHLLATRSTAAETARSIGWA